MIRLRRVMRLLGAPVLMALALLVPASADALEEVLVNPGSQSLQRAPTRVRRPVHPLLAQALSEWKQGRVEAALALLDQAAALAPDDAGVHLAMGNLLHSAGRREAAADAYLRAIRLAPTLAAAHFNRGAALRESGRLRDAVLAYREAARLDPADFESVHNVVATLAESVRTRQAPIFYANGYEARPAPGPISIVVCSIDPVRLARFRSALEPHLQGVEHEVLVISDARSLCEGYARGLQATRHETVVLMHDDVQLVSPQPFHALVQALEEHDVVGLAGSRRAAGTAVLWAGHPHIHGWVSYPAAGGAGYEAWPLSLEGGVLGGMQALDGLLLAMRRETGLSVGFDCETFDGFHFYDLDFCVRAYRAGLSLAVTTEVIAVHESAGRYDDEWRRYAARFSAKYPELEAPKGSCHAYLARLGGLEELARFHRELAGLARVT